MLEPPYKLHQLNVFVFGSVYVEDPNMFYTFLKDIYFLEIQTFHDSAEWGCFSVVFE